MLYHMFICNVVIFQSCLSVCHLSIHSPICPSVVYLSISLSLYPFNHLSICPSVCLSICFFAHLSIHPLSQSVHWTVSLSIHLSLYIPSICLSMSIHPLIFQFFPPFFATTFFCSFKHPHFSVKIPHFFGYFGLS